MYRLASSFAQEHNRAFPRWGTSSLSTLDITSRLRVRGTPLFHQIQFPRKSVILPVPSTMTWNRSGVCIVGRRRDNRRLPQERTLIFIHHANRHVRHGFPRHVAASVVEVELLESRDGDRHEMTRRAENRCATTRTFFDRRFRTSSS